MARKKRETEVESEETSTEAQYKVINLKEQMIAVPYYTAEGTIAYLNLRLQARGGQVPPVISQYQITDGMRDLEKKKIIRLEKI